MYIYAIETVAQFTRPIHSISRSWNSEHVQRGAVTLFFVNSDGWALTCKHVAQQILMGDTIAQKRNAYIAELATAKGHQRNRKQEREIARKYGYSRGETFELLNNFMNCVDGDLNLEIKLHPTFDVALIHFIGFTRLFCDDFPIMARDSNLLKPGMSLCRIGFPFPEFTNYEYDSQTDSIRWTNSGRADTPRFPIDGMVTRHLVGDSSKVIGFEMSTPGLRGQSGGPVFDAEGRIWGMQAATAHLDLDFDVDQTVIRQGIPKKISESAFLHVGHCIHIDILKTFMAENGVQFEEG